VKGEDFGFVSAEVEDAERLTELFRKLGEPSKVSAFNRDSASVVKQRRRGLSTEWPRKQGECEGGRWQRRG